MAEKKQFDAETLKKHHFWIITGSVALIALLCWFLATNSLAKTYTEKKGQRESVRTKVDGYKNRAGVHPNQQFINYFTKERENGTPGTGGIHTELKSNVYEAWSNRYNKEQRPWVTVWPDIFKTENLLFLEDCVRKGTEIPEEYRLYYGSRVPEEWAKLYPIIKLREPVVAFSEGKAGDGAPGAGGARPGAGGVGPGGAGPGGAGPGGAGPGGAAPGLGVGAGAAGPGGAGPGGAGGGFGGAGGNANRAGSEYEGLLAWTPAEREYLQTRYGTAFTTTPTSDQMRYTQEGINVYRSLLQTIIGETNGFTGYNSATREYEYKFAEHSQVPIKKIISLRLGEDAGFSQKPQQQAEGGAPGQPGAAGGMPGANAPGGGLGGGFGGNAQGGPRTGEYVPFSLGPLPGGGAGVGGGNRAAGPDGGAGGLGQPGAGGLGQPGPGGAGAGARQGAGAVGGGSAPDGRNRFVDDDGYVVADPSKQPYAEFRMLPVHMHLVMDVRKVHELLANCVDSPLPLEVRQINLRRLGGDGAVAQGGAAPGAGAPGGGAAGGPAGAGAGVGLPPAAGSNAAAGAFGGNQQRQKDQQQQLGGEIERGSYDMEVEIRGIVYLFNPPNAEKLGTGETALAAAAPAPEGDDAASSAEGSSTQGDSATQADPTAATETPAATDPPAGAPGANNGTTEGTSTAPPATNTPAQGEPATPATGASDPAAPMPPANP